VIVENAVADRVGRNDEGGDALASPGLPEWCAQNQIGMRGQPDCSSAWAVDDQWCARTPAVSSQVASLPCPGSVRANERCFSGDDPGYKFLQLLEP
jgi:hypothetical protein